MVALSSEKPPSYVPDHVILCSSWPREGELHHLIMENLERGLGCKDKTVLVDVQESVRPLENALVPSPGKMTGFVYKRRRTTGNSVAFTSAQTSETVAICRPVLDSGCMGKQEVLNEKDGNLSPGSMTNLKHVPSSSVQIVEVNDDLPAQTDSRLEVCRPALEDICLGMQEVDDDEDGNNMNIGPLGAENCSSSSLNEVVKVKDDPIAQAGEIVEVCGPTQDDDCLGSQETDNEEDCNLNLGSLALGKRACASSVEFIDLMDDNKSVKNWCALTLMKHGLITATSKTSKVHSICAQVVVEEASNVEPCKVCGVSDSLDKMLICDSCDEAFHLACCYPKMKRIPIEWWHCRQCKSKNRKAFSKLIVGDSEASAESEKLGSDLISFMLRDTEPYTTQVRIGKAFQAEVLEWGGPVMVNTSSGTDNPFHGTPLEALHEEHKIKKCNSDTSIGNWLQCQHVISDESGQGKRGVICGKWRRAPLFEVQTSDWECFCTVLWDPSHADCAVPQEISTEEIMKHLKFIELLKSRLAGKARNPNSQF
ncbi:uncharacterized protein LOC116257380 isoform X2 [Nymphaea colorata]|uniref:uncharacterized protein LOC116257380 isoform X2 n=1 Tax=Nymphaea colorata TaxID=210225 RepID=UPI00129E4FDA|nr:uncharacterized protein LOC116257380 isoform X2 [Nymphaea colorata]